MFSPWGAANKPAWGILRLVPKLSQIVERIADCLTFGSQPISKAFLPHIVPVLEHLLEIIRNPFRKASTFKDIDNPLILESTNLLSINAPWG